MVAICDMFPQHCLHVDCLSYHEVRQPNTCNSSYFFFAAEWERFASQLAVVWKELAATWINYTRGREAMVLHFENLRLNPRHDLSRLLDYLGISMDERRIDCVLNHIDGPFRRPQSSQQMLFKTR
jgi:hypothetical protein